MIIKPLLDVGSGTVLLDKMSITESAFERLKGLLGSDALSKHDGLLIKPCNSVHTFFMSFAIDVVYLDKSGSIIKIVHSLSPWRLSFCFAASATLELADNNATLLKLSLGQQLKW